MAVKGKTLSFNGKIVKVFDSGVLLGVYSYLISHKPTATDTRTKQWVPAKDCAAVI